MKDGDNRLYKMLKKFMLRDVMRMSIQLTITTHLPDKDFYMSQAWWHIPVIPALGWQRQKN
jgi:hypothetical protein